MVKKKINVIEVESPRLKALKHQARRRSIKEGIFSTTKSSLGDHFISPFAIAINSSNSLVAMLSAITGLLSPLSQLSGSRLMEKYSRKKITLKTISLRAFFWPILMLLAFLFYKGIFVGVLPIFLLIFFSVYTIIIGLSKPAWFSWQGDIVDEEFRGRWFSKRTLITGFVSAILAIGASFFLDFFKSNNWTMFGFMFLFFFALLFRLMTFEIVKREYEPKMKLEKGYYFSFWSFLMNAPKNNFGRFSIFRAFLSFAVSVSAPLTAVYLLRYLNFGYSTYMIIVFAGTIFSLFVLKLWGRIADRYGNYRLLQITAIFIPAIPLLWVLNSSPIYLVLVPSLISGVSWAGFHLAAGNFIYDNVSQQKRGLAVSYYNLLIGIGVFLGAGLGALLIKVITISVFEPIIIIFLVSAVLRTSVVFIFLSKLKEVKKKEKFKGVHAIKDILLKDVGPTISEEIHEIMSIKKYILETK